MTAFCPMLNEIAWGPGDPGTGAPSFSGIGTAGVPLAVPISQCPIAFSPAPLHMEATAPRGRRAHL